ncbi:MAG: alpha/beta hydrolase [Bacteroidota bacterium]
MKQLKLILLISLLTVGLHSCSDSDSETPIDQPQLDATIYTELLDVPYGDADRQKMDIYLPANRDEQTKVIFLIHGGAWTSGQKEDMNEIRDLIQAELPDLAIININYRLASIGNPPFPMQIDDISAAVDFLKANSFEYVVSEDIGLLGTSAGGQLALLWSYAHDVDNDVEMVCSIVGPTNFTDPAYTENNTVNAFALLTLFGIDTSTDYLESISPFHRVSVSSPPTVLFYGGQDELIPTSQGVDLENRLTELGVTHSFTLYPNEGHGWEGEALEDTWTTLKSFIQVHLE